MLIGVSRSYNLGSGGVTLFREKPGPAVEDGTTLPDIDRPFKPNGTGGFRIPVNRRKKKHCE